MQVKDLFKLEEYSDFYYEIIIDGLLVVCDLRERVFSILSVECLSCKVDSFEVSFNDSTVAIRITSSM